MKSACKGTVVGEQCGWMDVSVVDAIDVICYDTH